MDILHTLGDLIAILARLAYELITLGWHYILFILWVVWWLWAVNWRRTWPALREGAWAPLVLLIVVSALVWSRLAPAACDCLGFMTVPNFWWQLGYVGLLASIALFCGWVQGVFHWAPAEVSLEPPAHGHGDHGHGGHGHGGHGHGGHGDHDHGDHGHEHGGHGHSHGGNHGHH